MAIQNKNEAISNLTASITNDSDAKLQPSVGFPVKSSNLQNYLQNLIDWLFPTNNVDLRGRVMGIPHSITSSVTNYSNLQFINVMPLGGIIMHSLNGVNTDIGGGKIRAVLTGGNYDVLDGFLFLDGSSINLSISDNQIFKNLQISLDGKYGNNLTTFPNTLFLPNMRGRVPLGYDPTTTSTPISSPSSTQKNYGNCSNIGGVSNNTLNTSQMPTHNHSVNLNTSSDGYHYHFLSVDQNGPGTGSGYASIQRVYPPNIPAGAGNDGQENTSLSGNHSHSVSGNTGNTGGAQAIENRMEYMVLNYLIKY